VLIDVDEPIDVGRNSHYAATVQGREREDPVDLDARP
jgi:hypothetical protein